ncbi:MAG: pitrilysin family protein [Candidatus Moranbacteria bacterium]|nr:pitrilysin family protein [Candidatus Moranbacteria bacterium]
MHYEKLTLKNGLRVILAPMKETQTMTVLMTTGTGSRYETRKQNGLSHFLEHMFFKGTKKRPTSLSITEELDAIGGDYNAYTSKERTGYYAKVDAKHGDIALDVVSDIFLNSKIDQEEIDHERGAILQEMAMYEDSPRRKVSDLFEELLYGDTPLGWDIIGTKENIKNFKRADFIKYLDQHYIASNVVVGVAGKFDAEKMKKEIAKVFKGIRVGKATACKLMKEKQTKPALLVKHKKTDQTHLMLGVRAFDFNHPDRYVLSVLATILGGNMSSRMFISVRERKGLAYNVSTFSDTSVDVGYLVTQCGVEHKNLEETITTVLEEYRLISRELVPERELLKAKEYIKGSAVMNLESSDEVVSFLVEQELIKGRIKVPSEIFAHIDAVTAEDVLRVAQDIFTEKTLNLAVIGPHKQTKKLEGLLKL